MACWFRRAGCVELFDYFGDVLANARCMHFDAPWPACSTAWQQFVFCRSLRVSAKVALAYLGGTSAAVTWLERSPWRYFDASAMPPLLWCFLPMALPQAWKSVERAARCRWGFEDVQEAGRPEAFGRASCGSSAQVRWPQRACVGRIVRGQLGRVLASTASCVRRACLKQFRAHMPQVAVELEQRLPPGFEKKISDPSWKGGPIAVPWLAYVRACQRRGVLHAC